MAINIDIEEINDVFACKNCNIIIKKTRKNKIKEDEHLPYIICPLCKTKNEFWE